jgi:hypothetical protein
MVRWEDDGGEAYLVAARIMLWARFSKNIDRELPPAIYATVQSLSQYEPDNDPIIFFAKGDFLEPNVVVISATMISTTAFVLPCVKDGDDAFPAHMEDANYFLVFPPRGEWRELGWSE